jgi:Lrp/AsnC family leucine-responsive transcriptional regulator
MALNLNIDDLNWKILKCLQDNARETFADIGRKVGLTPPAVAERIKKMEDLGIIEGYTTKVSHAKVGHQLKAIITLRAFMGKLKPFLEIVKSFKEVVNCYRITGNENIVMEVVLSDQFHLEEFIDKLIQYGETRTHIVLSNVVSNAPIGKKVQAANSSSKKI